MVAVVGASGSGKSSLVRAGFLASLEADVLPGSMAWTRLVMRPGRHPMRERRDRAERLAHRCRRHAEPVGPGAQDATTDRVVLVVDQLEELWTTCADDGERAAFLDFLAEALRESGRLSVVLVVRADYVASLADHAELARLVADSTVLVGFPTPDDIRRSVEVPSVRAGLVLDVGLADAIVGDAGQEPGILPLLSAALTQLWEQQDAAASPSRRTSRSADCRALSHTWPRRPSRARRRRPRGGPVAVPPVDRLRRSRGHPSSGRDEGARARALRPVETCRYADPGATAHRLRDHRRGRP